MAQDNNQNNTIVSNGQNQEMINQAQKMIIAPNPLLQAAKAAQPQNLNAQNPKEEVLSNDNIQKNENVDNNKPENNVANIKQNFEILLGRVNKQLPAQKKTWFTIKFNK